MRKRSQQTRVPHSSTIPSAVCAWLSTQTQGTKGKSEWSILVIPFTTRSTSPPLAVLLTRNWSASEDDYNSGRFKWRLCMVWIVMVSVYLQYGVDP